MERTTIQELSYYPIKSLRGITVDAVHVRAMGYEYDRRWMLVDEEGMFLTQRDHPILATFSVRHDSMSILVGSASGSEVSFGVDEHEQELIPVTIWDSRVDAFTMRKEVDLYFSDTMKKHVRLVRIPEAAVRRTDPRYSKKGDHVSFADGFPILLTCTASLADLNQKLETPIPMGRFRPNLVVTSSIPFEEEGWTSLRTDHLSFRIVKRCARCVITTTDQSSGERTPEPLRTLASYRKTGNDIFFGMNCIPDGDGMLSVGDAVSISS